MDQAVEHLGLTVAAAASVEIAARSFGAISKVELSAIDRIRDGANTTYMLEFSAESVGDVITTRLAVLDEFLDMEPEQIVHQLTALLIERLLPETEGS
jgi:hypothetical protein